MPQFDLRGIRVAEYTGSKTAGDTYGTPETAGDAMAVNLELRFAEGRLYAESSLAEYLKKATGGTMSMGVKYLPESVQKLLYGYTEKSRQLSGTPAKTVKSLVANKGDVPSYVGVTFYAPDMIDGVEKYTCVFVRRSLFGPPSMALNTMGESISFATPTTSGEFLPSPATGDLFEVAILDSEAECTAWGNLIFGVSA